MSINPEKLTGKWRLTKIVWENGNDITYADTDNWTQYVINSDGTHQRYYHNNGIVHQMDSLQRLSIEEGNIFILQFDKPWFKIYSLDLHSMILKMLSSDSYFYYRKIE